MLFRSTVILEPKKIKSATVSTVSPSISHEVMAPDAMIFIRSEERRVGKEWKQWQTLFFWAPKSLHMVTAALKLKDAYSLEGKL